MLAFLALPLAKSLSPQLSDADRELTAITLQMSNAAQEDEPLLLDQLTKLAAKIEASLSASDYRFSAAHAYYSIVERRISELRDRAWWGMQPFRESGTAADAGNGHLRIDFAAPAHAGGTDRPRL